MINMDTRESVDNNNQEEQVVSLISVEERDKDIREDSLFLHLIVIYLIRFFINIISND